MAGKCKEMNKIKQALRLHLDGESNRSIGRKLDLYKGTVNKYITLAESCGIPIPVLLSMEEPEIERVLTGGNPAYSDSRFQDLKERLPYIASELERKHMTMFLLWREYRTNNPEWVWLHAVLLPCQSIYGGSETILRAVSRPRGGHICSWTSPGTRCLVDLDTGEEVKCQIFVVALPFDYGFAMAVKSRRWTTSYALECCRDIGVFRRIIVTDNLKHLVSGPVRG